MFQLPDLPHAFNYGYVSTPIGLIEVAEQEQQVKHIYFVEQARSPETQNETLKLAKQQLSEYMTGERQIFDLPLAPEGTDFQKQVWAKMQTIKSGDTLTYKDISDDLKSAPRAVGGACGKNPIPIIIPCHRVLASNGGFGGYSGDGGIDTKKQLLTLEGAL